MTTIATIALPLADSWQITVGGGWIAVMLIGMAFCSVAIFAFISLTGDRHRWSSCGFRWPHDTTGADIRTGTSGPPESEAGNDRRPLQVGETALAILDRRFAEGAVSLDEYRARRDVLGSAAPLPPTEDVTANKSGRSSR